MMESITSAKATQYAKTAIILAKRIKIKDHEFAMSDQFLRACTSVSANATEAEAAQSRRDFICKLVIARKELKESFKWTEYLCFASYITQAEARQLSSIGIEIFKLLNASIRTAYSNKTRHRNHVTR